MRPTSLALLGAPSDRWLVAFTVAVFVVLVGGWYAREAARKLGRRRDDDGEAGVRGLRRRAGALLAVGPLVGLLVAPRAGDHVVVAAVGAVALAVFGALIERRRDAGGTVALAAALAAVFAMAGGVRFAPTGVGGLDVLLGGGFVFVVTLAFDGLGNADSLVPGLGALAAFGLLALGGFAEQRGVANVAAGTLGAAIAFLAYNLRPASLFPGRAGRLALGFTLAVLACSVSPAPGPPATLVLPVMLLGVPLLDVAVVIIDRAQRRRPVLTDRRDHLVHRMVALGASPFEAVAVLVIAQGALVVLAILAGRGIVSMLIATPIAVVMLGALAGYTLRAPLDRMSPVGLTKRTWWVLGGLAGVVALGVVPLMLGVPNVTDEMQSGRLAAQRGLAAARSGDAGQAELEFRRAAGKFQQASDEIGSVRYDAARLVPGLAPNLRAVRALADIGYQLAHNGELVTAAVVPEALTVVDGRLPIDEVRRITPALTKGRRTLDDALARLRTVEREPYLLGPVRDAIDTVRGQLARAAQEARNTATAAKLAPAIFGGSGETRRYLLVVQNNAEARATGGLIGSFGVITAQDGKLSVSRMLRTEVWNKAVAAAGSPTYEAPEDYIRRYGQFQPQLNLQNVNLSPDFPTVGRVLETLTPEAGVGEVDGVMAVDPAGLAALLELTGPVPVSGWPVDIDASNVVGVTLRDAYNAFARTPERADFLGDVAQAVVDRATSGRLGAPASVAKALGTAAHQGHLMLSFRRPEEQRLAQRLEVAGAMPKGGDVLHVTDSNLAGNKLDFYLTRDLDYRLDVRPDDSGRGATANGSLTLHLDNTAPKTGLPRIVAGPYEGAAPGRLREGELVSYVSVYNPLDLTTSTLDGQPVVMTHNQELGTNVYSTTVEVDAQQGRTLELGLDGRLQMARDGWYELHLGRQPLVSADRARVSISVPDGFRIVAARGLQTVFSRRATGIVNLDRPTTVRVKIEQDQGSFWGRLTSGH